MMGKIVSNKTSIKNFLIIVMILLNTTWKSSCVFMRGVIKMGTGFNLNRINPNQTQIFFEDGRYETLTDDELEAFLSEASLSDRVELNLQDPMN
jgi:hypothetical protein